MHIYAYGFAADRARSHERLTLDTFDQPAQIFFSDPAAVKATFSEVRALFRGLWTHRILFCIPGGKHGSNDTKSVAPPTDNSDSTPPTAA